MSQDFFNHLFILLALMIGFTCFKVAKCKPFSDDGEQFSWKELLLGTCKYLIVIVGACVVYVAGTYCGADLLIIEIGDTKVTIQAAIDITILAIVAMYGAKYVKHLAEFMGLTKEETTEETEEELVGYVYKQKGSTSVNKLTVESVSLEDVIEEAGYGDEINASGDDLSEEENG